MYAKNGTKKTKKWIDMGLWDKTKTTRRVPPSASLISLTELWVPFVGGVTFFTRGRWRHTLKFLCFPVKRCIFKAACLLFDWICKLQNRKKSKIIFWWNCSQFLLRLFPNVVCCDWLWFMRKAYGKVNKSDNFVVKI